MLSGILLLMYANHFGPIKTTLYPLFGHPFFIGMIALAINLAVVGLGTGIAYALGWRPR
jgi:SSS family solute:Na+ symporter